MITEQQAALASATPLLVRKRRETEFVKADYFAEEVRRQLADRYGQNQLYKGGLSVQTSLDPRLQAIADRVLRAGLENYDRRHGWRGPVARVNPRRRLADPSLRRSRRRLRHEGLAPGRGAAGR